MIKSVVQNLDAPIHADEFLSAHFQDVSRTQIKKFFDGGLALSNRPRIKARHSLQSRDILKLELIRPKRVTVVPRDVNLEIVFEDDHVVVVTKLAGRAGHQGNGITEPIYVEGVLAYCELNRIGGEFCPGLVHRLDKHTTSAIVFPKTDAEH
jgi:23S rRNA pseudouridine1911/1915/1917 synthase